MGDLFFGDLWLVWVLVPVYGAWVVAWFVVPWAREQLGWPGITAVRFSSLRHVRRLRSSRTLLLRQLFRGLRWLTVALLMTAMLRPQTGRTLTEVSTEGIDIVLAIDTSGSMQALDLDASERTITRRRNRLEVAKDAAERFIRGRENDQIGLVVFGEQAFTQCPLTLDHGVVATFLERLRIGMAGEATAIGSALGTAVKRLRDSPGTSKVVVLLTDGRNTAGSLSPLTAADVAKTFGVKVYTIGAGSRGQAPFLVDTRMGPQVIYQDAEIDEATLQRIAEVTGGKYFRAEDEGALAGIYAEIDELERTEITMESYMEYNEQFRWLVLPAMALLLLEVAVLGTRLRKLP